MIIYRKGLILKHEIDQFFSKVPFDQEYSDSAFDCDVNITYWPLMHTDFN